THPPPLDPAPPPHRPPLPTPAAPAPGRGGPPTTLLFTLPEELLGGYLGFFGGALLYLAAAEILPEAHHTHPARSTLLCTVGGVGFIWLVVGIAE
ncbi:hypothetical protein ACOZD1_17840, partial [Streptomyces rhizosphaericola]